MYIHDGLCNKNNVECIINIYRLYMDETIFVLGQQVRNHHVIQRHVRVHRRNVPHRTAYDTFRYN